MLLVLVMVLSMLPATVFATGETDALEEWSITLGDNIGVKFYLNSADYTVTTTVNGVAVDPEISEKVVTVKVAAAQMTDTIVLTVKNGEETVHTGEYSVRQYAETILTGEYDVEVKEMVREMLNYGAAAQTYFNYNTGKLANAGYELETAAAVPTEVPEITAEGALDGISLYGMSLVFQSKTAVRFYFNVSGNISDYTFKVGETAYAPVEKNGQYYVEVGNINPQNLENDITMNVNDGAMTVTYSPLNYIVRKYNSAETSDNLKALVQAMYGYHVEAEEYASIIWAGTMSSHSNGWNAEALYFSMAENAAPIGDAIRYTPTAASNIKLIRGGVTYDVAHTERESLVKSSETSYYIPLWVLGDYKPLVENDILIVSGSFKNAANNTTINISKSYVLINADGTAEFSTEMPTLPTTIDAGTMSSHSNGWNADALYFTMAENAAPIGDAIRYVPTANANIKLIRDGATYDVGHTARETIVKASATGYYIALWTLGDYKPLKANDILVVEGGFTNAANKTTLNISKSYVLINADGTAEFSTEMPTLPTTIDAGTMSSHSNGWNADALYFTMAENAAPIGDAIRYVPTANANIKLIRDGATYDVGHTARETIVKASATGYYIALWTLGDYKPLKANDILVVEGGFTNAANKTTLNISKSYILINADGTAEFSTEMPTLVTTIDAGMMSAHSTTGWKSSADAPGNLLFAMADNDAPSGYYRPTDASNVQLIRDGNTYIVGHNLRDTIAKENNAQYVFEFWTVEKKPMQVNDILVVEGGFYQESTKTMLNISKTYILLNADGSATFSAEMPNLGKYVEGGLLTGNEKGWTGDSIYFSMNENEAPYNTDWSLRYKPASSDVIKLLRDGNTINIANKDAETLVKYSETNCALATWMFGSYGLKAGDILIVEGDFIYAAENVTLNVQKSYILLNADGSVTVSATEPVPATEVDCGVMSEHADGSASEIYFSLTENSVPADEELVYPYAGTVQLVNGSNVSTVNANIYKLDSNAYYLELDGAELADGDYLIVEGGFANADNGITMNIQKTYVLADGDSLVYSETEPVLETEFALTGLTNHSNGWSANGIYITHDAHAATIDSQWSVEYKPVSTDAIKLVRNGVTTSVGQPASGTLVVYGATEMYLKTAAWTIQGNVLPFVDGDQIIIEGKFKHEASGDILVVEKTVIYVNGSDLIFNPVFAGNLANHSNGVSGEGVYATMAENDAPYDGWSIEYTPVAADSYYVIRNGEQINIGIPGRGTLVKYSATEYFLKINAWCTNNFAYTTDDIIVIDGFWKQNTGGSAIIKIEKTYLYHNGSAWVFATELPSIIDAGLMQTHGSGMWGNGISFTMAANAAPYDEWNIEYKQTSVDNIKLIRDGETISIGIIDRPLLVKYGETDYYLKLEKWTIGEYGVNGGATPITNDDIIIIEGNFVYDNVTLKITKSYVYYDGSAWVCSATEPVPEVVYNVGNLSAHASGGNGTGFYATGAENGAPYDWAAEYAPTSKECIQIIRGGETIYRNNTGAGAIVKFGINEYFVKFDTWIDSTNYPLQAGDMIIIEGTFVGTGNYTEAEGVKIKIDKTYVTYDGTSFTFITDADKYINAGAMSAYDVQNWFDMNYNALYFVLDSNIAPGSTDWSVRYMPLAASNVKLIRNGETVNIGNTGAETIVKIEDGLYALALDNWWWSSYAPIQDGDQLIIEGKFANSSNGYTLKIDKTYITFVSKADDNVVFSTAASTEFGDVLLPNTNETLTIGMWNGSYHVFEDKQLRELQAAGITKIMGIDTQWIGTTDVNAWLDRVYSYGISVIMDLRSWDGETVPSYASHPGVLGFLMYDEPCATEFDNLATLKAKFDAVMPEGKLFYVNLFPSCAAGTSLMGTVDWALGRRDYDTYYVQKFMDKLDIEVLSWDNYSLLDGNGIRTDYFYNFEVMASKNVPMWYTMLSAGHGTTSTSYATPTEAELRWQMAVAMTYGVQNIDHYTYVSHEAGYSCMVEYETWEPTDLYYDILKVDNEYLAWDNIFMAYDWIGVAAHSANSNNAMLTKLNNALTLSDYGASVTLADQNLLIGVFDYNGDKAYMVTNAGSAGSTTVGDGKNFSMADASVTLTLADGDYKCVAVIDNGEISYVAVENNTVTLNVEAYEGVFVIPVLN